MFNEYKAFPSKLIMLFRTSEGKLVELNRYDCKNDHIYYKKIMHLKKIKNNNPKEAASSTIAIQKSLLQNNK